MCGEDASGTRCGKEPLHQPREWLGEGGLEWEPGAKAAMFMGQEGLLKAAGSQHSGASRRAWRWSWGDGVSGEHPVWGTEGHLCTLPTLQFWGGWPRASWGWGAQGSGGPRRPAWALWCPSPGSAMSL